jgi:hypothetical protein
MATTTKNALDSLTWGQLVLGVILGVAFIWLGFIRHKAGFWWKVLGVIGVLNVLISLGQIAARVGKPSQAPPSG